MLISSILFAATAAVSVGPVIEIANAQWGFRTSYPSTWVVQQGTAGPVYVSAAPPAPETLVRCNTTAEKIEQTKTLTQTYMNEQLAASFGEKFWSEQVFARFKNVKVESHASSAHNSGIRVQTAIVAYDDSLEGKPVRGRTQSTIFMTPGASYSISCNAEAQKFAKYKIDFAGIVNSFRLSNDNTVNVLPPSGPQAAPVAFAPAVTAATVAAGVTMSDGESK